jgi:hypothetical protein
MKAFIERTQDGTLRLIVQAETELEAIATEKWLAENPDTPSWSLEVFFPLPPSLTKETTCGQPV